MQIIGPVTLVNNQWLQEGIGTPIFKVLLS